MKPTTTLKKRIAIALFFAGLLLATTNIAAKQTFVVSPDPATSRLLLESLPGERDVEHVLIKNLAGFDVRLNITLQPRLTDDIWVFSLPNGNEYKLPANETIRVPVAFSPRAEGRYEDVLSIVDEFGYGVRLKVYGISNERCILRQPAEMKLGPVPIGERACQTVEIANPTTEVVVIRDIALDSRTDEFSLNGVPELPARIQPGEYMKIVACYKPAEYIDVEKALIRTTYYCANAASNTDAKIAETVLYGIVDPNLCRLKVREFVELVAPAGEKICEKLVVANGTDRTIVLGEINLEQNGELGLEDVVALPVRIEPGTEISVGAICYKPDGSMAETKGRISYTYLCENAAHRQIVSTVVHGILRRTCTIRQTPSIAFRSSNVEECKEAKMENAGDAPMRILEISIVRTTGDWKLRLPEIPFGLEPGDVKTFAICHVPTNATTNSACLVRTVYLCANSDRKQEVFTKAYLTNTMSSSAITSGSVSSSGVDAVADAYVDVGIQIPLSAPAEPQQSLTIRPNPASVGVKISGFQSATIEIHDMLGRQINTFIAETELIWDLRNQRGELVPGGAYNVLITGTGNSGRPYIQSRQLIIEK